MRVAMVSSGKEACGIADYTAALASALRPLASIQVIPLRPGETRPAYFRNAARSCNAFDLVHVQHEYVFFGGRLPWSNRWPQFLAGLRVPCVVTMHTCLQPFPGSAGWKRAAHVLRESVLKLSGWSRYLSAGQFAPARAVIVHTAKHRDLLVRQGCPAARVHVLPQGVPAAPGQGRAAAARRRWNLEGRVAAMFGFLSPAKGHVLALEAWEKLGRPGTLVIAGRAQTGRDEAYAEHLRSLAARLGSSVCFTGYLSETELADLLAASDVVLMPYRHATSSYALSLALAHGCAVLASDLDHFREIRRESPCVELFLSGDAADLARRLEHLLRNPGARAALSAAAGQWAQAHSWRRVAALTAEIYRDILKGKSFTTVQNNITSC